MARLPVFLGAVALSLMHPAAALAAPTGGAVHHAVFAPVRSSSSSQSSASSRGGDFKVPFDVDVRPRPLPGTTAPEMQRWWPGLAWRRTQLWYVNPCVGSGATWGAPGLQATWTDELTMPGFSIGSLAGNANNLFSSKSSPYDAAVGPSTYAGAGSGSSLSFGYGPPATLCGTPGFGF